MSCRYRRRNDKKAREENENMEHDALQNFLVKNFHTFYRYTICERKQQAHTQFNVHFQCVFNFLLLRIKSKRSEQKSAFFFYHFAQSNFSNLFSHSLTHTCSLNEYEMNSAAQEMIAKMFVCARE